MKKKIHIRKHIRLIGTGLIGLIWLIGANKNIYADVVLNEIDIDSSPQRIELYNTDIATISISGFYIDDNGGTTFVTIPQNTTLGPFACMVFPGDFNLNKSSADTARLFDATSPPTNQTAHLIDSFSYTSSPGIGFSFARNPDGESTWMTSTSSLGLFNTSLLPCIPATPTLFPTETPIPTLIPTPTTQLTQMPDVTLTPSPTQSPSTYDGIIISEIMTYPQTNEQEWVELYNANDTTVKLVNWYIDDIEDAGSAPKKFSLDIPAHGYSVFELSSQIFNNDADNVRLLDANRIEKDSLEYTSSLQNQTWGRVDFSHVSFCLQEPSKGIQNNGCIISPTQIISVTVLPTLTPLILGSETEIKLQPTQKIIQTSPTPTLSFIQKGKESTHVSQNNQIILETTNPKPVSLLIPGSISTFGISLLNIVSICFKIIKRTYGKTFPFFG